MVVGLCGFSGSECHEVHCSESLVVLSARKNISLLLFVYVVIPDLEVAQLTSADYGLYTRPRTTSPLLYRSSLSDRFDERPWSPAKSELISNRVERALRRNRSLERLDHLSSSPYTSLVSCLVENHQIVSGHNSTSITLQTY